MKNMNLSIGGDTLRVFENAEFGSVRTISIDGEPYFVGKDVAEILGYAKPLNALAAHVDEDDSLKRGLIDSMGRTQETIVINESGLYSLVFGSKLESAKRFKRWVTTEVLPSIRKHGAYAAEEILNDPDVWIDVLRALKDERAARIAAEQIVKEQKPLVEFANHVANSSDLIDIGDFSKIARKENIEIGRNRLFKWLRDNDMLMDGNIPYQRYIEQGIFEDKEHSYNTAYGDTLYCKTYVTGKGQIYLIEKLRNAFLN